MSTPLHIAASLAIDTQRVPIAEAMVSQQYARHPELAVRFGVPGRIKCLQDANHHLDYLAESLCVAQPLLFADYLKWARVMLAGRNIPVADLLVNMECLSDTLRQTLDAAASDLAVAYVTQSMDRLEQVPATLPSFISESEDEPLAALAQEYLAFLLQGERQRASQLILEAVEGGVSLQDIYLQVLQPCQHEIGRLWQMNRISVAQEHYCTAATQLVMSQLYPYLFRTERVGRTLVATCIAGDLHEVGVRMVSDLFELSGWDTYYLGANTPLSSIVQTVCEKRADVLAVSATIAPHLKAVEELIIQVRSTPDCSAVKVLVGGYPFSVVPDLWRQLGADGCAYDAISAVELANQLLASKGLKGESP
jgi:methanogenic corrinoid protein MtbC1